MAQKYFALAEKVRGSQRSQVIMAKNDDDARTEFSKRRMKNSGLRELHHQVKRGERRLVLSIV